jgi:ACS family glucarate transporter-like MFS transporter
VAAVWAFVQDVGEPHVASVLGWGNMWGNIGAAVAPILYNSILGEAPTLREWNTLFLVCAVMAVVAGFAGLAIDATRPVFRAPAPPAGT